MEFPRDKFKPTKDRYSKARGGPSKFLYIACGNCEEPAIVYQKDGSGRLLRCYTDRIVWPPEVIDTYAVTNADTIKKAGALACNSCDTVMGIPMVYESENRPALRLIPGTIHAVTSSSSTRLSRSVSLLRVNDELGLTVAKNDGTSSSNSIS